MLLSVLNISESLLTLFYLVLQVDLQCDPMVKLAGTKRLFTSHDVSLFQLWFRVPEVTHKALCISDQR